MEIIKLLQSAIALLSFYNFEKILSFFTELLSSYWITETMSHSKSICGKKKCSSKSSNITLSCLSHVKRSGTAVRSAPPAHWVVGTSVTDVSGSMSSMGTAVTEGMKAFLDQQQEDARSQNREDNTFWRHVTFESKADVVFSGPGGSSHGNLTNAQIDPNDLSPRGCTRLIDTSIEELGKLRRKRSTLQKNLPTSAKRLGVRVQAFFTLLTDGLDNESKFLPRDLNCLLHQARKEGIVCTFLGANQDAVNAGKAYGFAPGNSLTFSSCPVAQGGAISSAGIYQALRQTSANIGRAVSGRGGDSVPFSQLQRTQSAPADHYPVAPNTGSSNLTSTLPPPVLNLRQTAFSGLAPPRLTRC
jgi:hypothetical protein